ncbi:2,3-bisphosphoglycerate-independent phosphoglycerate mutase [bacterium]|nr:MAG: 2,3-bisphosphoglycerate-independent phosphoglycerate mutase [bacterium]
MTHLAYPLVLCILDGFGCSEDRHGNAIAAATMPHWRDLLAHHPHTELAAAAEAVGLPKGIMGNSEVGHLNLGSGRVVPQGVVLINASIADGSFARNDVLQRAIAHVARSGGTLHFLGLLSPGCVHSSMEHLFALIDAAADAGVRYQLQAFLDGRDTPPSSARAYVEQTQAKLDARGGGSFGSIIGRFYAMDRDKRWERTQAAYDALVRGKAERAAPSALEAVDAAYAAGETDEFVKPTIVGTARPLIASGDACIFFNFRPDRARQLTMAFSDPAFDAVSVERLNDFLFATMTKYEENFSNPVLFEPHLQRQTFGEVLAEQGLSQLRLAETEKYAHVTYFFSGGREEPFAHEDRILIPSDRSVPTYDLAPRMRAREITDAAIADLRERKHDVIVMNYANADMVGHTGVWDATLAALGELDTCLGRLAEAVLEREGILAITADHGNAEEKIDAQGHPLTAHTTNRVPFVLVSREPLGTLESGGCLGDVAPTLLEILGVPIPPEMTGRRLFCPTRSPA